MCSTDPKFKQELPLTGTPSSSTSSCSLDLHSPKEGISVTSEPNSLPDDTIPPSNVSIKEEIATPGPSGDFPSPSASPVSESSFPKISEVYDSTQESSFITNNLDTEAQHVAVSPGGKFFPETTQTYPTPSTSDASAGYYVSYASSTYPTSYNTSFSHPPDMYANACVSPNYLSTYQTAGKGYTWPTTPNGVGYSTFSMTPTAADMYQYQAQTYQQMAASRATYPNYFTGQAATLPHTMS